jgi:hypothetical protein
MRSIALLVATLVLSFPGSTLADSRFGRLFTTPQQRAQLDDLREARLEEPERPATIEARSAEAPDEVRNPLTLRGTVTRTGGPNAAWINDSNTFEGDLSAEYLQLRPEDIGAGTVRLPATGERRWLAPDEKISVPVRVGQTLEPSTGTVMDLTTRPEPREEPSR